MFGLFQSVKVKTMSPSEFAATYNSSKDVLLDVRTASEFSGGAVKTAKNVDFYSGAFNNPPASWDKNKRYFVYCAAGGRSNAAAKALVKAGFTNVYDLGGYGSLRNLKVK